MKRTICLLNRKQWPNSICLLFLLACFVIFTPEPSTSMDIADYPLELAARSAPPVIMIVVDDSSSMDSEFITPEKGGIFNNRSYVFPENPGNNTYTESLHYINSDEQKIWKSQWYGYNLLYYNPKIKYTPWPATDGSGCLPDADISRPRSDPMTTSSLFRLDGTYMTVATQNSTNNEIIRNAHYFILNDKNKNRQEDSEETLFLVSMSKEKRDIYRVHDNNNNGLVDDGELEKVSLTDIPEYIRPESDHIKDLSNFANWYSYHRKRSLSLKASVGKIMSELSDASIGLYSINRRVVQSPQPARITDKNGLIRDKSKDLLEKLYRLKSKGPAPLREAVDTIGKYYMGFCPEGLGQSPFAAEKDGGECQKSYCLVFSDGYWAETPFTLRFEDPDEDRYKNTLADVAITYFLTDLRPDLADLLFSAGCNSQKHQHMVTFTLGFSSEGTMRPEDYTNSDSPCDLENEYRNSPAWTDPYCGDCKAKTDDLWHAATSTGGFYFNFLNINDFLNSLKNSLERVKNTESTLSKITASTELFYSSTTFFQTFLNSFDWSGDLEARHIYHDKQSESTVTSDFPLWNAAEKLNARHYDSRNIITYDGEKTVSFSWNELNSAQKNHLNNDPEILSFLRGKDVKHFRKRKSKLGDIAHSHPLVVGKQVYVGANDGMLHAFNTESGEEIFSYIPDLVFPNLPSLADRMYTHKFFIDQTPVCSYINISGKRKTWLVGGLGKGGKGYYCLDITDTEDMTSSFSSDIVKWEFSDKELGYTFSEPVIVRTKSAEHEYVVVFGNGYSSHSGFSMLYIIDAVTGKIIRKFNTETADNNGMSSPVVTDVNNDGRADFVYAGDLKGNIWKWSLESDKPGIWDFSYRDKKSKPAPLFTTPDNQPITSRPDVMHHPDRHGYIVCFGTGKFLEKKDLLTENIQAIYGIWDYGDDPGEYLGKLDPETGKLSNHPHNGDSQVRLSEQTITSTDYVGSVSFERTISKNTVFYDIVSDAKDSNPNQRVKKGKPNPRKDAGWYLNLTASERVIQNVRIFDNILIVTTRLSSQEPCNGNSFSIVYTLDPSTGGMVDKAFCIDRSAALNEPLILDTPDGIKMMFDRSKELYPFYMNKIKKGIYFWRQMF